MRKVIKKGIIYHINAFNLLIMFHLTYKLLLTISINASLWLLFFSLSYLWYGKVTYWLDVLLDIMLLIF